MTREEATARLCKLMDAVNVALTDSREPADCICEHTSDYRNSGTALEFVEEAVREALAKRGAR